MPGLSITNLRNELRLILGLDDTDLPNNDADLLLNRAWWQIQNLTNLPANEIMAPLNTVAGTNEYAISYPTEAITSIALLDPDSNILVPLTPISEVGYDKEHDSDVVARGKPEKYFTYGLKIILEPTPDDIYTLNIRRRDLVTDLSDGNPSVSADNSLHEVIMLGAAHRGFLQKRDFNSAQRTKIEWRDALQMYNPNSVKEEGGSAHKFAQVKVIRANEYKP